MTNGLSPLRTLEKEVRLISSSNLIMVSIPSVIELAQISSTLNLVISNLKDAFDRERRFTADVAHELRTPISEIRTAAEVALQKPSTLNADEQNALQDILASAKKCRKLFKRYSL